MSPWDAIPDEPQTTPRVSAPASPWDAIPDAKQSATPASPWDAIPPDIKKPDPKIAIGPGDRTTLLTLPSAGLPGVGKFVQDAIPVVVRVGGAIGGGIVGGIPGGIVGAGLGETAAEGVEVGQGTRESLNPVQIAVQSALGAIPGVKIPAMGTVGRVAVRGAEGAVLGGAGAAGTELAEGRVPTLGNIAHGAGLGAVVGGALGGVEPLVPKMGGKPKAGSQLEPPPPVAPRDLPESPVLPPSDKSTAEAPRSENPPVHSKRTTADIERLAEAQGKPVPEQQPLPESRQVEPRMAATLPEQHRQATLDIIAEHGGFEAQRRGVQPMARTEALASGIDTPVEPLAKGSTLNAEEAVALNNARRRVAEEMDTLAPKVASGEATPLETLRLAKLRTDQVILTSNYLGVAAETGRALNAHKILASAERLSDDGLLELALRELEPEDLKGFAEQWSKLPNAEAKRDFLHTEMSRKAGLSDWLIGSRYAGLLSSVQTHFKNLFGTVANTTFRDVGKIVGTGLDAVAARAQGRPRTLYFSELQPEAVASAVGARQGMKAFLFTLKHGYTPPGSVSAFDTVVKELPGGGKNPLNIPGRLLNAEDALMYQPRYQKQLAGRAFTIAKNEGLARGLKAAELDTFVKTRMAELMTAPPADLDRAAHDAAAQDLYREKGGKVSSLISAMKSGDYGAFPAFVAKVVVPFHNVPGNILRQGIENIPGGHLVTAQGRATAKAGGRAAYEMAGRQVVGGLVLVGIADLAQRGLISGYGPTDPNARATLMAQGWRPHAVKIGPYWVDYTLPFQAAAAPVYAMANLYDTWRTTKGTDKSAAGKALVSIGRTAGSVLDQSYLTGLADMIQAANEPDRYMERFGGNLASSFVPFAALTRNVTRLVDPTVRDVRSASDYVVNALPGGAATLPPKLTPGGEPVQDASGPVMRAVSPVGVSRTAGDLVSKTLADLKVSMGVPTRTLDATRTQPAVTLTQAERQAVGRAGYEAAQTLVQTAAFQRLVQGTDAQRKAAAVALGNAIDRAHSQVYNQIRAARRQGAR